MSASVEYINSQQWTDLFQVSPSQFNVTCQLQKEEFLQLSIINSCNDYIAWKLKTNRPGRYMVSPKQGIIAPKEHKDCTVVLSKLKEVPDTKKPDKFLIQATKVNAQTQIAHLPQLWKDRESKHDKKRGVYAYQAVTIKCFLTVDINKSMEKNIESKQNEKVNIIEDYVSSESTADPPSKHTKQSQQQQIEPIQQMAPKPEITTTTTTTTTTATETPQIEEAIPPKPTMTETTNNTEDVDKIKDTENTESGKNVEDVSIDSMVSTSKPTKTDEPQYNAKTVEQWRRKAQEYDELFQFVRKTLAQRDELIASWKAEQEKTRSLQKLNREMKEEKKHILREYNKYRKNQENHNNDDDDDDNNNDMIDDDTESNDEDENGLEDDEKRETLQDEVTSHRIKRQKAKYDAIREMDEIDKKAARNSNVGFTISIVHIIITILLMYASFAAGKWYGPSNIDTNHHYNNNNNINNINNIDINSENKGEDNHIVNNDQTHDPHKEEI